VHWPDARDGRLLLASVSPLPPAGAAGAVAGTAAAGTAGGGYWSELEPGIHAIGGLSCAGGGGGAPGAPLALTATRHAWRSQRVERLRLYARPPAACEGTEPQKAGPAALAATVARVLAALRAAVATRVCAGHAAGPPAPGPPPHGGDALRPARVMLLFSGGCDSTLLAALADDALPPGEPIDLCSVCFDGGNSPDRLGAMLAVEELAARSAGRREWRMLRVDASLSDLDAAAPRLRALLAPAATVMDLNIGGALWLAASGRGALTRPAATAAAAARDPAVYTSRARIVLLGHGADEQCGGYGRHRSKFVAGAGPPPFASGRAHAQTAAPNLFQLADALEPPLRPPSLSSSTRAPCRRLGRAGRGAGAGRAPHVAAQPRPGRPPGVGLGPRAAAPLPG